MAVGREYGHEVEDRIYNQKDYDRNIVMERRTELVARKVAEFLEKTDPFAKTIVFCEDIDHAERMRVEIGNASPQRVTENHKYVMKITGDDNEGKAELDNFIHPEEPLSRSRDDIPPDEHRRGCQDLQADRAGPRD